MKKVISIGIDATSIVDGGGLNHLKELVENYQKQKSTHKIIIYASKKVLDQLPNHPRLFKHNFRLLNKSRAHRLFFQFFLFDNYLKSECDIFLTVAGDYVGSFRPYIAMSQNMMLYERQFWKEIKSLKEKAIFFFNYKRQKKCFKNAEGIIFLSQYAKDYISRSLKIENKNTSIIHHGISPKFLSKKFSLNQINEYSMNNPFRFLYVSTVHVYKNQWNVVEAISKLRQKGYPVALTLIGNVIYKPSGDRLNKVINQLDPDNQFVNHILNIPHGEIADKYFVHDGIIFASTCENMPNILLESMASGKPIACSNKQPMPEFLKDGGFYFNANSVNSIFETLEKLLNSLKKFEKLNKLNVQELKKYNWEETTTKTIEFIEKSYLNYKNASE